MPIELIIATNAVCFASIHFHLKVLSHDSLGLIFKSNYPKKGTCI